jgi:DNA mismatch endonuclease (patch repair protein)
MQAQAREATGCEVAVCSALHEMGLRFQVNVRPLADCRRRADIVFGRILVAVFIDGCFWHGCPEHGRAPRTNRAWWRLKIRRNRLRDADTDRRLIKAGWLSLRFWEHEGALDVASQIASAIGKRTPGDPGAR